MIHLGTKHYCIHSHLQDNNGTLHATEFDALMTSALDICACGRFDGISRLLIDTLNCISLNPAADKDICRMMTFNLDICADLFLHWFYELGIVDHGASLEASTMSLDALTVMDEFRSGISTFWETEHGFTLWHAVTFVMRDDHPKIEHQIMDWILQYPAMAPRLFHAFLCHRGLTRQSHTNCSDTYLQPMAKRLLMLSQSAMAA